MILFSQLPSLLDAQPFHLHNDVVITHLLTDSRKTLVAEGSVFFALRGERHNGHVYVHQLYEQGIRNFVLEEAIALPPDANVVQVPSTLAALQKIVAYHRTQFAIPVIGITGSNGKTIIKEWLYQLLSQKFSVVKNPGSYNSQIGVPLSVWNMAPYHTLGIFEAGISQRNEMEKLQAVLQPTIGIFTNIGSAHSEGFANEEEKIKEKCKLFAHAQLVVHCKDHSIVSEKIITLGIPTLSWGFTTEADVVVTPLPRPSGGTAGDEHYTITYKRDAFPLTFPFSDPASIENCMHCVVVMLHFHFTPTEIQTAIAGLRSVPMRLELKEGINQSQLIDDSYNNDLAGLQISLDFLNNQQQRNKRVLILSDVLQTGLPAYEWTAQIAALVKRSSLDLFVGIGHELSANAAAFTVPSKFYPTTESFLSTFSENDLAHSTVLVKGARMFGFERIVQKLQRKIHGTVMEIDLGAMVHNLNYFKSRLKPATKIMAMVKAFAYGSGSKEVANLLQYHHVDYLGVAYADEGVELRKNNVRLPMMVMNPSPETFETLLAHQLEPELYSFGLLQQFVQFLNGRAATVHIKFDTGMHRLGFAENQVPALLTILTQHRNITVATVFSHLAGADEPQHDEYSHAQAGTFVRLTNQLTDGLGYKPLLHLLNSPGILRLPVYQFDMVRLGIGLYGIDPTAGSQQHLKSVATLKTVVSQLHELEPGETVGYGRHGKITNHQRIATIAIGYADGYSRAFSRGVGEVLINGKKAPVIGNVCMDMTMINVTGIDVKEGDEVIVFGEGMPIDRVAKKINTIPYEILTSTSERVKRVFTAEGI